MVTIIQAPTASTVPATDAPVGLDSSLHPVSQAVTKLKPHKTYHF